MFNPVSPTVTLNPFSVFFETLPPSLESSSPTPGAGSSSMASLAAMAAASSAGLSPSSLCSVMLSDDLSSLTSSTSLERLHTSPMHKSRLPSSASSSSFPDLAFLTQSSSSPSLPASGRTPYASMDLSMSTPVQLASNTYGTYGTLSSGALPASMSFPFTPDGASTPNAMERAVEAAMLARPRHVRQQSGTPQAFSGVAMVRGETPTHRRVPSPSTASMSDISSALSSNTESSRFAFTQSAPEVHRSPHQHQVRVGVASAVSYDDDSSMTDTSPLAAAAAAAAAHKSRRTRNLKILPPPATPIAQLPASDAGPMLVPMHQLNEVVVQQHQLAKAEFQQRRQERRRMKRSASRELHRDTVSPVAAQAPVAAPQPVLCPDAHHTHPTSMEVDDSDEPASPDNGPKRRRRSRSASSSDDSDFICTRPGCGKSFSSRYSLRRHQKQHTGERPHACPFDGCTRRFAERSTLIRHVRVHTGEKPFECPHPGCTRRFSDRTNVKRHALTHNGGRPYPCPHAGCNKAYTRRCYLNKHLSTAHGDE